MNQINLDNYLINYQVFFKNIKHMYLRYENNMVKITCHKNITEEAIELFILNHKKWILDRHQLKKIELYSEKSMYIFGKEYPVFIDSKLKDYIQFDSDRILMREYPLDRKKIENFYKKITILEMNHLVKSNKSLLSKYINSNHLVFKAQLMKTRLGSCIANKRVIKLNSLLARFDREYIKLVLFHELSHLKEANHSRRFYDLFGKLYPNYKIMNQNLKKLTKRFIF
ncbi:M48 family metallopeptidase [Mycoplasmatota bacterium]|nr:M48 family metallopeptidase [Mycoplasmatota bacterium]